MSLPRLRCQLTVNVLRQAVPTRSGKQGIAPPRLSRYATAAAEARDQPDSLNISDDEHVLASSDKISLHNHSSESPIHAPDALSSEQKSAEASQRPGNAKPDVLKRPFGDPRTAPPLIRKHGVGMKIRKVAPNDPSDDRPAINSKGNAHEQPISTSTAAITTKAKARESNAEPWNGVKIQAGDKPKTYPALWLRDMCTCPACVDPSSKQKNFSTTDIPENIEGEVVSIDEQQVTIKWKNDIPSFGEEHVTSLAHEPLARAGYTDSYGQYLNTPRTPWIKEHLITAGIDLEYDNYMQNDESLYQALVILRKYGLLFLKGVPESTESVEKIAERIGPLKTTLYGRTWDVKSVPEALNVAYTSGDLGFHMDLLPVDAVPALQLLHCIRSSAKGGKSLFSDTLRVVKDIAANHRASYDILRTLPVTYHYDHPETHMYKKRRVVIEGKSPSSTRWPSKELQVNWSPPFQGPFEPGLEYNGMAYGYALKEWHKAAKIFNDLVHQPNGIYDRQMAPGECVIFANRRVLHARTAFEVDDAGKERWLVGAYIDQEPWYSKHKVLERKFGQTQS